MIYVISSAITFAQQQDVSVIKMIKRIPFNVKLAAFPVLILLLLLFLLFSFLESCGSNFEYTGDRPELYSVAINSILGVQGFAPSSWGPVRPSIIVLDEDSYGRVMFLYYESSFISPVNIVIMQKVDGDYVYFYPHYNFFPTHLDSLM